MTTKRETPLPGLLSRPQLEEVLEPLSADAEERVAGHILAMEARHAALVLASQPVLDTITMGFTPDGTDRRTLVNNLGRALTEAHSGSELLEEVKQSRELLKKIREAVGVRAGESLDAAVLRLVEDASPERRWEKRARAMHTWLMENVPVPKGSRWRAPEGYEFVAEGRKGEGGPFSFEKASGTGYFVSEDHPATLGWVRAMEDELAVLVVKGGAITQERMDELRASMKAQNIRFEEDTERHVASVAYQGALTRAKDMESIRRAWLAKPGESFAVRMGSVLDWVLRGQRPPEMTEMVTRALEARDAARPPEQDADAAMRTSTDGPPEGSA